MNNLQQYIKGEKSVKNKIIFKFSAYDFGDLVHPLHSALFKRFLNCWCFLTESIRIRIQLPSNKGEDIKLN